MYPNLCAEIARTGLPRKEVAKAINKKPATFSQKLNGYVKFELAEAIAIKEFLGCEDVPIEVLFDWRED